MGKLSFPIPLCWQKEKIIFLYFKKNILFKCWHFIFFIIYFVYWKNKKWALQVGIPTKLLNRSIEWSYWQLNSNAVKLLQRFSKIYCSCSWINLVIKVYSSMKNKSCQDFNSISKATSGLLVAFFNCSYLGCSVPLPLCNFVAVGDKITTALLLLAFSPKRKNWITWRTVLPHGQPPKKMLVLCCRSVGYWIAHRSELAYA